LSTVTFNKSIEHKCDSAVILRQVRIVFYSVQMNVFCIWIYSHVENISIDFEPCISIL